MAERQEGIPVTPTEREHAEALHILAADMVVDPGQQFHFLGAVAAEQGVVDDEDVPAAIARQWRDCLLDDGCAEQQRELAPVDGAGVHEPVERIPLEWDSLRHVFLLLVERAPFKRLLECDQEDGHDRKATHLVGIAAPQDLAYMELRAKLKKPGRKGFTGVMTMWYNIHGMSPPFVLWIFALSLYKTDWAYAIFILQIAAKDKSADFQLRSLKK